MNMTLVMSEGPDAGRSYSVPCDKYIVIGRGDHSDLQLSDPRVSRKHCRAIYRHGRLTVEDLGGSGGVFYRGKQEEQFTLADGDSFRLGETVVRCCLEDPDEAATINQPRKHASPSRAESAKPPALMPPTPRDSAPRMSPAPKANEQQPSASHANMSASPLPYGELIGRSLAFYRIDELVAAGTAGVVFRATDTKNKRPVALKVLGPELCGDEMQMKRFVRSMKAALRLKSAYLVKLYGAGRNYGYCWVAMEWIDGQSLAARLADPETPRPTWAEAFLSGCQVAAALDAAHRQRIVHRNLTPKNILVSEDGRHVKLGDLMQAKALEGTLAEHLTRPGQIVGDVTYLAPERLKGGSATADIRADLYSLGAILYEMLTGHPPFEQRQLVERLMAIQTQMPSSIREQNPDVPESLEIVVMKLLSKRPEDRYATPIETINALKSARKEILAADHPVFIQTEVAITSPRYHRSAGGFGPLAWIAGGVLGVAAAFGLLYANSQANPQRKNPSQQTLATRDHLPNGPVMPELPEIEVGATTVGGERFLLPSRTLPQPDAEDFAGFSPDPTNPKQSEPAAPPQPKLEPKSGPMETTPVSPTPSIQSNPLPATPEPITQDSEPSRLPVPEADERREALKKVRDVFAAEYSDRSPQARFALATRLFSLASEVPEDTVQRYVLLTEARSLALEAADLPLVMSVNDRICDVFEVDTFSETTDILAQAARGARTDAARTDLMSYYLTTARQQLDQERFDVLTRLMIPMLDLARHISDPTIRGEAIALRQRIDELRRVYPQVEAARQRLQELNTDPMASEQLGRWLVFVREEWDKGLPLLARGTDTTLATLASDELSLDVSKPAEQIALADQWREHVSKLRTVERDAALRRALFHYQTALPHLAGLERARVEKEIATLLARSLE